jgi:plasmid stabilization system protein ParE
MKYIIRITEKAMQDINEAADHIEFILMNPEAADNLIEAVETEINKLVSMPERHKIVNDPVLETWEIRMIDINNYLAFYTIDEKEKTVNIIRFLYGKRNWITILSNDLPKVDWVVGLQREKNSGA